MLKHSALSSIHPALKIVPKGLGPHCGSSVSLSYALLCYAMLSLLQPSPSSGSPKPLTPSLGVARLFPYLKILHKQYRVCGVGPPLSLSSPIHNEYVRSPRQHHTAASTESRTKNRKREWRPAVGSEGKIRERLSVSFHVTLASCRTPARTH